MTERDMEKIGGHLGRDRAGAQCPGEEPPGGGQVAPLGLKHVDDLAVLVNRAVQVGPPPGDLDVRLAGETTGLRVHAGSAAPPR
jgi:hypothetical protein